MRILVTNDDGITAPGLSVAEEIASTLAGPDGEVWVVAPMGEQSGVGHAISYVKPMRFETLGARRVAVDGTPADCVATAVQHILPDPPDLVLSGVNRGFNLAEDILYSGTIGAAIEATYLGLKTISMSQYYTPAIADDPFEAARHHGADTCRALLDTAPWRDTGYRTFYNVNFPPLSGASVKGTVAAPVGRTKGVRMTLSATKAPNGREYLMYGNGAPNKTAEPGTDARLALEGYITVTPLCADLTDREALDGLRTLFPQP